MHHTGPVRTRKAADIVAGRIRLMMVRGELRDGDWLPTEPELMVRFGVSRPTLREAFRLLESESLITVRRGPPGGARVHVPGPAAAAPIFGLLLALAGTSLADVHEARMALEAPAAGRLARHGSVADHDALAALVGPAADVVDDPVRFTERSRRFHQRLMELAGNHTLATVSGMLTEIVARQATAPHRQPTLRLDQIVAANHRSVRSYQHLVHLVRARQAAAAEQFWVRHLHAETHRQAGAPQTIDIVS
jgi:DNA-binding FadR family transcriptional regulator